MPEPNNPPAIVGRVARVLARHYAGGACNYESDERAARDVLGHVAKEVEAARDWWAPGQTAYRQGVDLALAVITGRLDPERRQP